MAKRIKVKGRTSPSSIRKKLAKEGNPRFVGPRTMKSELAEYRRGTAEPGEYAYLKQRRKLRAPELRRLSLSEDYGIEEGDEHSYGRGGISKNKRLKQLLMRLMDKHLGGGQEFDAQD